MCLFPQSQLGRWCMQVLKPQNRISFIFNLHNHITYVKYRCTEQQHTLISSYTCTRSAIALIIITIILKSITCFISNSRYTNAFLFAAESMYMPGDFSHVRTITSLSVGRVTQVGRQDQLIRLCTTVLKIQKNIHGRFAISGSRVQFQLIMK